MKKVKKNNRPLLILLIGLLISGCLIGFSIYKMGEHKEFLIEDRALFDKKIEDKTKECNDGIAANKKAIEDLKKEVEAIDREITLLQRQKTDVFMEDRGWSDRYYALEDQITAKRKEQTNKNNEIRTKNQEITAYERTLWEIENEWEDEYKYKFPGFKKGNPYIPLGLGIFGCIITFVVAGISKLNKVVSGNKSYSEYEEINEGTLSQADINDGVLLKKELFSKLQGLLKASCIDDYDTIRKLCTKNMAKSYIDEIELLKKHKQKLVISDVENKGSKIVSAHKTQRNTRVVLVQKIKAFNYTKDVTNNEIINGDDKNKSEQAFKLVFVKDYVTGHSVKQCPNCGASVKDATRVDCQYCGTVFDNSNYDWYLESKVIISEE